MREYTRTTKLRAGQWFPGDHNLTADLGMIVFTHPDGSIWADKPTGVIRTMQGDKLVNPGDWVVRDGDYVRVVPADRFDKEFAPADESPVKPT